MDIFRNSILELRENSENININDVKFINAFDTGAFGGFGIVSWYGGANNVTIKNVQFDNIGQSDLGLFEGQEWDINGLFSTNNNYMAINIETSNLASYLRNINIINVVAKDCRRSIISLIYNSVAMGLMENINITNVIGVRVSKFDDQVGCIRFRGGKSINISNVNLQDSGGIGIKMTVDSGQSVENVNISNVVINNITSVANGSGVVIVGTEAIPCKNISISGLKIINPVSTGFNATYLQNSNISDVLVQSPSAVVRGFNFINCKNLNISCKTLDTKSAAIGLLNCKNINLNNSSFENSVGNAINIAGESTNIILNSNIAYDTRDTKLTTIGLKVETSILDLKLTVIGNDFSQILNPLDANMISYASNIVQDNILSIGNSTTSPLRSSSTTKYGLSKQSVALLNSSVANATDLPTAIALVNDLKNRLNSKFANDRSAGLQAP